MELYFYATTKLEDQKLFLNIFPHHHWNSVEVPLLTTTLIVFHTTSLNCKEIEYTLSHSKPFKD